jgi:hypothetical protein
MEIVISFILGNRLGMNHVVHPEQSLFPIKRLIQQVYPQAIYYRLSRQDSGDPHNVLDDIFYDSSDLIRKSNELLNPEENEHSEALHAQFPFLRNDLKLLNNQWPLFRPCRLFRTMGDFFYEGIQFMIRSRGYGSQVEEIIIFPISFYLLARRYEDHSAQHLAQRVHTLFVEDYDKRVKRSASKKNISTEALILEIDRFIKDSRFWKGNALDFNLEAAL